jgi:NAD(P)-dependent dehydrogenase (short-subunit alcohol dehydrogenase family)
VHSKVIVITGGTGRLGTALALRLKNHGVKIAATYLIPGEAEEFEKAVNLEPDQLLLRRVDATDPSQLDEFMNETVETFGQFGALASLVGGWAAGQDIDEASDLRFDRMLDLNLRSAFYTLRAAIPHLKKNGSGRVVFIGSRAVLDTPAGQAAFNVAKAGVVALASSAANELRDHNITVNTVLPAIIDTPASRSMIPFADYMDWPEPDEVAAVLEFLTSEEAGVVSGASVPAYGNV